ncbi:uncharacterized protein C8Q71DRAFT_854373 [Rhodofomes roseus]|uniref:Uncharacterized protein n=1 Tax=Rhodofomes roseus TaxID=34475 RepID=A0ABQ8KT76_9APHY|nr:uncharacterized protein C8Q71DRAFT_854373 [Rhodofomes roseus]KAH9842020.1 hypothetical protein C8Q71DRAFT_854373 [Rhodofomes roseus]
MSDTVSTQSTSPRRSARLRTASTASSRAVSQNNTRSVRASDRTDFKLLVPINPNDHIARSPSVGLHAIAVEEAARPSLAVGTTSTNGGESSRRLRYCYSSICAGLLVAVLSLSLLLEDTRRYVTFACAWTIYSVALANPIGDTYAHLLKSMVPVLMCLAPTPLVLLPSCRLAAADHRLNANWSDYVDLVAIQSSWVAGTTNETLNRLESTLQLYVTALKIHRSSQSLFDSMASSGTLAQASEALAEDAGKVARDVIELHKEASIVAQGVNDLHWAAIIALSRVQSTSHTWTRLIYPGNAWIVSRLFEAVDLSISESSRRLTPYIHATLADVFHLAGSLAVIDDCITDHCPRTYRGLGARGFLRSAAGPEPNRCRDLMLIVELARYDIREILTSIQDMVSVADNANRQIMGLRNKLARRWETQPVEHIGMGDLVIHIDNIALAQRNTDIKSNVEYFPI